LRGDWTAERVSSRINSLRDSGIVKSTDYQGTGVLLSPHVKSRVPHMRVPEIYSEQYRHVIDPLRRVRGLYNADLECEKPHLNFSPAFTEVLDRVYRAIAMTTSEGDLRKAVKSEHVTESRELSQGIASLLTRLNLDLNHGSKREDILHDQRQIGLGAHRIRSLLTDLSRIGVLERVGLGYHRVNPEYWFNKNPDFGEIKYDESTGGRFHSNINEDNLNAKLKQTAEFENEGDCLDALRLLRHISNMHKRNRNCARAVDIRDLMQMMGMHVTESQVTHALARLCEGVEAKQVPPLLRKFRPSFDAHETFYRITDDYLPQAA